MEIHPTIRKRDGFFEKLRRIIFWRLAARTTRCACAQNEESQSKKENYDTGID
jgi:hypothetical protein